MKVRSIKYNCKNHFYSVFCSEVLRTKKCSKGFYYSIYEEFRKRMHLNFLEEICKHFNVLNYFQIRKDSNK